ncbi:MAG: WecB/TagA/CpsF family glycosyltransferase [Actinobacteria bacterium]|nr:WecB/TagA/CpsF family glycosyltransferase [Actinomycetota bacterium]
MTAIPKRTIAGIGVSIADYTDVLDAFDTAIESRQRLYVCCAPASTLIYARRDLALTAALRDADIVTPDGMGVVYAARLLGERLPDRVYGPDLMLMQLARAEQSGQSIWLYGGFDDEALRALLESYGKRFPALRVAGSWSPPHRPLTDEETRELVERINGDAPDVVWVGLGTPKQDIWMHEMRERLDAPVLCGVGAAFDFHAGRVAQAPRWMQNAGLEWLFRLTRDPWRMLRRYAATLPHFAVLVGWQALRERIRR